MSKPKSVNRDQYEYATGRIRALELNLLDSTQYARLYDARTTDDINRILAECGYPQTADPEASLAKELFNTYELIGELMADSGYIDVFLLLHDFHNIKTILKYLIPSWSGKASAAVEEGITGTEVNLDEPDHEIEDLPEFSSDSHKDRQLDITDIQHLFLLPSLISPQLLYIALTERQPSLIPAWAYQSAVTATAKYQSTYDVSDVDIMLDQSAYQSIYDKACSLGDADFLAFVRQRIDLINLGMVLRARHVQSGSAHLSESLLQNGCLKSEDLTALYEQSADNLIEYISKSDYSVFAETAGTYSEKNGAARFNLEVDNFIVNVIRRAKKILSGPEVPLAYLIARDMEIKNIRIITACVRNGIPMHQARDLARDQYLDWR